MQVKSAADMVTREATTRTGDPRRVTQIFGQPGSVAESPQVFCVGMHPGGVNKPHFHPVDQFQLLWGTPGSTFQRHAAESVMGHYSDAYSPYGPIVAGPVGVDFFTMRLQATVTTEYMPGARDKMPRKAGRNLHFDVPSLTDDDLREPAPYACRPLLASHPDGLAAYVLRAGPGARVQAPTPRDSAGQMLVIVAGTALLAGKPLSRRSSLYLTPSDALVTLEATREMGFQAVALHFPKTQA